MKKDRLIIAFFGLISATLIASISMTFAWYASGELLGVNPIVISFVGDKEIFAALPPENPEDEIDYQTTLRFNDEVFDKVYRPVSSMFSQEWLDIFASKPVFRTGYQQVTHDNVDSYTRSNAITLDEDGYFSKELYLYSKYNVIVTLNAEETKFLADEKANKNTAKSLSNDPTEIARITEDLNNVTKSLRMSLLIPDEEHENREEYKYYIVDPYKEETTYLCGPLNTNDPNVEYYDCYYTETGAYEYYFGEYNNESKLIYDESLDEDEPLSGRVDKFNAKHRKGTHVANIELSEANGFVRGVENSLTLKEADITTAEGYENGIRVKLNAFEKKKIVLSMYLEGWDKDNIGYTEKGQFTANIQFKIGEEHF